MDYAFVGHDNFESGSSGLLDCRIDTVFEFFGLFFRQAFLDMYHFGSVADGTSNVCNILYPLDQAIQQGDFGLVLEI